MKTEDLFYYPTIETFEWDEAIYLLKYKDDQKELWLVAIPFGNRCEIADELFVRYGDDKDFTQEGGIDPNFGAGSSDSSGSGKKPFVAVFAYNTYYSPSFKNNQI